MEETEKKWRGSGVMMWCNDVAIELQENKKAPADG